MLEYRFQATDATIDALRLLKSPWLSATLNARSLVVQTQEATVRISVERHDVHALEAQRIRADVVQAAGASDSESVAGQGRPDAGGSPEGRDVPVLDLAMGRNDVVLFAGETWVEQPPGGLGAPAGDNGAAAPQVVQFSGRAGQRPPTATIVCTTTDAVVVAAGTGSGILISIGARPMSLEVVQDRAAIARFLVLRGYAAD